MQSNLVCLHLLVTGRVQGVGYRASLQEKASALRVLGWVRNCRDGRVEAHVQGLRHDVNALHKWCHQGPPAARVQAVTSTEQAVDPGLTTFQCVATA